MQVIRRLSRPCPSLWLKAALINGARMHATSMLAGSPSRDSFCMYSSSEMPGDQLRFHADDGDGQDWSKVVGAPVLPGHNPCKHEVHASTNGVHSDQQRASGPSTAACRDHGGPVWELSATDDALADATASHEQASHCCDQPRPHGPRQAGAGSQVHAAEPGSAGRDDMGRDASSQSVADGDAGREGAGEAAAGSEEHLRQLNQQRSAEYQHHMPRFHPPGPTSESPLGSVEKEPPSSSFPA